jgi:hypothetical protein
VDLVPENGELSIVLRGDLAAMLSFAINKKPGTNVGTGFSVLGSQGSLVAGARNQRSLRLIEQTVPQIAMQQQRRAKDN